jgi:precorrin-6B methylase 2
METCGQGNSSTTPGPTTTTGAPSSNFTAVLIGGGYSNNIKVLERYTVYIMETGRFVYVGKFF